MSFDHSKLGAVHILVRGRVQGVFFRAATETKALSLGITGFVSNLPDGTIEIFAEGSSKKLEILVEFLRTGPPRARVEEIIIEWSIYSGHYSGFSIK
jgi:acylphosphatase